MTFKVGNPNPGSHKIDLTNQKFGNLTVKCYWGLDKHKNKLWDCECDCGNSCQVKTTYLKSGKTKSCGCGIGRIGKNSYNYNGYEDITGTKWNSIENNAKTRDIEFNVSKEEVWKKFIEQNKRCFLTNLSVSFKEGNASVDRVDNDKGYDLNNIIIVHKDVNLMRNKFSINYFKKICKLIVLNNKQIL